MEDIHLNVSLLRAKIPNLTVAARSAGLRPATVSNLCTGKIPVGRAEVRTLAALAELAGCTMDELILRGRPLGMLETGIKVIDLLAPLVQGGSIGLVARQNVGQLALLAELFYRFNTSDYATVFWKPEAYAKGIDELLQEAEAVGSTSAEVYERILQCANSKEVVLGADRAMVLSGEIFDLEEKLKSAGIRPVTTILVDVSGNAADEELPFGPLDTFLRFDAELTTRGLFPAIDPVASTSVMLEGAQLEPLHLSIQQEARKLMRRYRELRPLVLFRGEEKLPGSERTLFKRGERLEAYLSQPFFIAEPFTKKKAEWIPLRDTLQDVRTILDGGADHVPVEKIRFAGRLDVEWV